MKSRGRFLLAVGIVVLVAFAATLTAVAGIGGARATQTVTFWSSNGLTGQSAFYGKGSLLAQQLLQKKINSRGGFKDHCGNTYTIQLKTWDDADTPAQAVAGMQKAGADKSILGVIGSTSDVAWLPEVPVAGQLKLPMIIPSDGSSVAASKWNAYAFRVFGSEDATFKVAIKVLDKSIHPRRIGVLYDITQQSQAFDAGLWKKYVSTIGAKVVAYESLRVGDTDYRPQLTKIKAAHPDFLVFDASEPAGIYNQAVELGLLPKIPAYSFAGINLSQQEWTLTHGAVKGSYDFSPTAIGSNVKLNDPSSIALYKKSAGVYPNTFQLAGWDALNVAIDAVKRSCTNSDREKFRKALAATKHFPLSANGFVTWHNPPTGENITPSAVVTRVTGPAQFVLLK